MKVFSLDRAGTLHLANCQLLLVILFGFSLVAEAQRVQSLSQARTLYIETFTGGAESSRFHEDLARHLAKSRFRLVQSPNDADAVVKGHGQIWVRGYIAINPRTPSTDRQAVYGGYLSLEVIGAIISRFGRGSKHPASTHGTSCRRSRRPRSQEADRNFEFSPYTRNISSYVWHCRSS